MKWLFACLLFAAIAGPASCFGETPHWTITGTQLSSAGTNISDLRALRVHVAKPKEAGFEVVANVPLIRTDTSFIFGDKAVVLGGTRRTQAVVIFDLLSRQKIDFFYCYEPYRIAENWIAYVEYYSAHSSAEPADVVLIYDLNRSPAENRLEARDLHRETEVSFVSEVQVGFPVYPKFNVDHRSYINALADGRDRHGVLGPPYFLLISSNRLLFLARDGTDFPNYHNYLVVVDLSKGLTQPAIQTLEIPKAGLRKFGENPNFIQATKMEEVSPNRVRLVIPESEYGVGDILVDVPAPPST